SGATAAQLTGAGISSAAVQTAANTLAAAGELAGLTVTGAGAAANALAGGANLAVNVGGNLAANTLTGGTGGDNIARNPADDKGTGTLKDGKLQDYNYQDNVNVQGELDNVTVLANDLAKQGATLGDMVTKYGIPLVIATGAIGAFGGGGTVAGEAVADHSAASAAFEGQTAYFGNFNNEVVALDLKARRRKWLYTHPTRQFPFYSSPAVAGGVVVLGGRDKMVHAISALTGKALWTFMTRARVESSPVIAGERVYVGSNDGRLYVLDLAKGTRLWDFNAGGAISASPALAAGRVVIGDQQGRIYCFGG
ncbi:MAG: hypothetical protein EBU88_00005, partial [Acidobacteria bacterium]|nr:hypothetical protein [Acidobacteriota bacterium]